MEFDAIVLAGGSARRMGGVDKADITIGGSRLLERVLEAVRAAARVIVVGPRLSYGPAELGPMRPVARSVAWTREQPPGGGPVAALGAGLERVSSSTVVVLAVDLPFTDSSLVARLLEALATEPDAAGAIARDSSGRDQYLAAAYRSNALKARLESLGALHGASMRTVIGDMQLSRLDEDWAADDCDTWDDVRAARLRAERWASHG